MRPALDSTACRLATLLLALAACVAPPAEESPEGDSEAELRRLRSLGYVGFSDEQVADDERTVTVWDRERSQPGYNLVSNRDLATAELFDARGRVLHRWSDPDARHWSNAELIADGDLLVTGSEDATEGDPGANFLLRLDWRGEPLWRAPINAHHDAEQLADGSIVALTFRFRIVADVDPAIPVKDHLIAHLDADGELIEEASLYDMIAAAPELMPLRPVEPNERADAPFIDLLHANSLEFMRRPELARRDPLYSLDHVLVSFRAQDTIAVFDWKQRRLVWAWGPGELSGQHDATVLADGHLLIFDNGIASRRSRIVELDPLAERIVWQYVAEEPARFFSLRKGSSQRLGNGNTLIADSDHGEAFEITPDGETVWRFRNPASDEQGHRATIVRIKRYPTELVDSFLEAGVRSSDQSR